MAFLQSDHVFQNSLRPPAREAHDSQSCTITRGSVPNDREGRRRREGRGGRSKGGGRREGERGWMKEGGGRRKREG